MNLQDLALCSSVGLDILFLFSLGMVESSIFSALLGEARHISVVNFVLPSLLEVYFVSVLWTSCSAFL